MKNGGADSRTFGKVPKIRGAGEEEKENLAEPGYEL
jgi:hypothetical protein